jgi:hypothetical protein
MSVEQHKRAELEALFASHMRARAMLKSVKKAEQELLCQIVRTLKALPASLRGQVVSECVEQAASRLVFDHQQQL